MSGGSASGDSTGPLLARARTGDREAAETLLARDAGRLRLYVRARIGGALARRVDVDDVVQETLFRAFSALPRFEGEDGGRFFGFLATLARHVLADVARAARRQKRSARVEPIAPADWSRSSLALREPRAETPGPATRVVLSEDQRRIESALASLPAHQRRVIVLRQLEQRSARDVAALTGSTEGAVHALYRRALQAWADAAGLGAR